MVGLLIKVNEEKEGVNLIPICSRYCAGQKQKRIGKYFLDHFRLTHRARERSAGGMH